MSPDREMRAVRAYSAEPESLRVETVPVPVPAAQALVAPPNVQKGQHVLTHGGSGGVGVYAIQLPSHFGAQVTATASPASIAFVRDLGATTVIDYTTPFETQVSNVDAVIDMV